MRKKCKKMKRWDRILTLRYPQPGVTERQNPDRSEAVSNPFDDSIAQAYARAPQVPIIVLAGLDDEQVAVRAVREGAQDYLVKGHVDSNLLVRAMSYVVERKRSEEEEKKVF